MPTTRAVRYEAFSTAFRLASFPLFSKCSRALALALVPLSSRAPAEPILHGPSAAADSATIADLTIADVVACEALRRRAPRPTIVDDIVRGILSLELRARFWSFPTGKVRN